MVEIGVVYNGSCKPQSCQKQKDNYSTACYPDSMRTVENNFFPVRVCPVWNALPYDFSVRYTVRHLILLSLDYRLNLSYENVRASSNVNIMFLSDLYFKLYCVLFGCSYLFNFLSYLYDYFFYYSMYIYFNSIKCV